MQICLSLPSKTFLLGEYAILREGRALVACTAPRFEVDFFFGGEGSCSSVHPESPAGRWVRRHPQVFASYDVMFRDPHSGRGGFGASTAQFLVMCFFARISELPLHQWSAALAELQLLQDFHEWAYSGEGQKPSGADLLAQTHGQLSCVSLGASPHVRKMHWPFTDKRMAVVRTGVKVASHQHLKELQLGDVSDLQDITDSAVVALEDEHWGTLCALVNNYFVHLSERGWQSPSTVELVQVLRQWPEVEAAKGCGALGADTLLLLFDASCEASLREKLQKQGLEWVADSSELSDGLGVKISMN